MIESILVHAVGLVICGIMFVGIWESTMILEDRKKKYREGTHDYYGNPIGEKNE